MAGNLQIESRSPGPRLVGASGASGRSVITPRDRSGRRGADMAGRGGRVRSAGRPDGDAAGAGRRRWRAIPARRGRR
jgi:hypothetical protein